jgi:hypothetical protein
MKDVGGVVRDYQAQTEAYRRADREVRLHECRSACTLALSLPNVCVYPDSLLKFHQAYNLRNHQTDYGVSQQLFDSYPAAVRARLGTLTRDYKVLTGAELIKLGIRDCTEPRIMLAAAPQTPAEPAKAKPAQSETKSAFAGMLTGIAALFGRAPEPAGDTAAKPGPKLVPSEFLKADQPLPPRRPDDAELPAPPPPPAPATTVAKFEDVPLPPERPKTLLAYSAKLTLIPLPKVITGAQPILPAGFTAYAAIRR